jgi:hypothetical protein
MQNQRRFGFADKLRIIRRSFRDQKSLYSPRAHWVFPSTAAPPSAPTTGTPYQYDVSRDETPGKEYRATINDIILTAIFRALFEIVRPTQAFRYD